MQFTSIRYGERLAELGAVPSIGSIGDSYDALAEATMNSLYKSEQIRGPEQLRRSLTWDQGKELARHVQFTIGTGMAVSFCDPKGPWQHGTNANTNGLDRQSLPRRATYERTPEMTSMPSRSAWTDDHARPSDP